jgi:hypothetical protein
MGVVIDDLRDAILAIQNPCRRVGRIALGGNAFIPIVKWCGGILNFDGIEPRIFTGRLIKMPVNADIAGQKD